jgi:uncharacterized protein YkwD
MAAIILMRLPCASDTPLAFSAFDHAIMRRMKRLSLVFIMIVFWVSAAQAQDVTSDLLGRINALRASLGLAPYSLNGSLAAAAQSQAEWMAQAQQISHTRPDGSTPTTRAAAAGYPSSFVSENIYGGTLATANDAWNFWINSSIHYRGLTNAGYTEVGIGHAVGEWRTFVLVFGSQANPYVPTSGGGGGNNGGGRASAPPSFIVGVDNYGNIMHEIQPGQTLGDIALIYGYTWDDIPEMLQLNNLTEANIRLLPVGGILLVPPYAGTYTPSPLPPGVTLTATPEAPTTTPAEDLGIIPDGSPTLSLMEQFNQTSTAAAINTLASVPLAQDTATPDQNSLVPQRIATSAELPAELEEKSATEPVIPTAVAMINNPASTEPRIIVVRESQTSLWLLVAIVVQSLVILAAGFEFARRMRRK